MSETTRKEPPKGGPMGRGPMGGRAPVEKAKDLKGTSKRLVGYLGSHMPALIIALLVTIASTVFSIFGPKILGNATTEIGEGLSRMIAGTGGMDFTAIHRILLFCIGLYAVSAILQYISGFIFAGVATKVSYNMRKNISLKINRLPLSYFDRVSIGDILSRITNDVDTLTQTLNQGLPQLVSGFTTIVGVLIMMFSISWKMTLIALLILPVSIVLVSVIVKKSQPYFLKQQNYLGAANGQVEEMYNGHVVVKAFNYEEESEKTFNEINENLHTSAWRSQFLSGLMQPVMNLVSNIGYVLVCIVGGFLALGGTITIGDIQSIIQYVRNFTQQISQITNISNVLQQTAAAAERVFEFLDEPEETPDTENPVVLDKVDGSVYFAHVNFGYVPEKTIIHDFSAIVEPGQNVAIVGPTGAGKTTMVKLLMRFYDVNSGAILIDGYDQKQFTRNGLRSMFGMVLQDTWLYNGTIMENIRYGRLDATDEEVIAAAKAAQADHFIRTLPDGYNMELNEDASNISQGQKQLLTIARTILSNPKVLILDEATSSVDTRTEVAIQSAMNDMMKGRTSFIIAHRLSTIRDADMILVMKDGDIVETGTHDELLAENGFYAHLYNSQFEDVSA